MKKIQSLLVLILLQSFMIIHAQHFFEVDNIRYRVILEADESQTYGTVNVAKPEFDSYEGDIIIPNMVKENSEQFADAYKVVGIDDATFSDAQYLKSVKVPASICSIGKEAFAGSSLTNIFFAIGGISEISEKCFYECKNLISIELPSTIKVINDYAFSYCDSLMSIKMNGVESIGEYAFFQCVKLDNIVDADKLQYVKQYAFENCINLKNIQLGSSIKSIGEGAFRSCCQLQSIIFPPTMREIGVGAFAGSGLISVTIPEGVKTIQAGVFSTSQLRHVNLHAKVRTIDDFAFASLFLNSITIPSTCTVSPYAFHKSAFDAKDKMQKYLYKISRCKDINISKIRKDDIYYELPQDLLCRIIINGVEYIQIMSPFEDEEYGILYAYRVCNGNKSLKIEIPDMFIVDGNNPAKYIVGDVDNYVFRNCEGVKTIFLPKCIDNMPILPDGVENYTFPLYMKQITAGMFMNHKSIKKIEIPQGVTKIGSMAFENSTLEYIIIPEGVDTIEADAFSGCKNLTYVKLPSTLKYLGDRSFAYAESLTHINLPNSLIYIGDRCFFRCPLEKIVIPESVQKIEKGAFVGALNVEIKGNPLNWASNVFDSKDIQSIKIEDCQYIDSPALKCTWISPVCSEHERK